MSLSKSKGRPPSGLSATGNDTGDVDHTDSLFRTLARVSPVGFFHTDSLGQCLYVNGRWCEMAGMSIAQAMGEGWTQAIHPDDRQWVVAKWKAAAEKQVPFREEYRFLSPSGKVTWVIGEAIAETDSCDSAVCFVGTITDITAQKRTENNLRLQSEITANAAEGIVLTSADGEILHANHRFENMFGYASGELDGKNISIINAPGASTPEQTVAQISLALETTGYWRGELENIRKDGSTIWTSASVSMMFHPDHGPLAITYQSDITDRKLNEAALVNERRRLKEAQKIAEIGSWELDVKTNIVTGSEMMFVLYGLDDSNAARTWDAYLSRVHKDDRLPTQIALENTKRNQSKFETTHRVVSADGTVTFLHVIGRLKLDKSGKPFIIEGTAQDVTVARLQELELKDSERRFHAMLEASPVPFAVNDDFGQIVYLNAAFTRTFGYTQVDIPTLDRWWPQAYPDSGYRKWVAEAWQERMAASVNQASEFEPLEVRIKAKDGGTRVALTSASPLGMSIEGLHLVTLYDITDRKRLEEEVYRLAYYDPLTKLPNRRLFEDRLNQAMAASKRGAFYSALMFVDLDNFKPLNDTHGHSVGDLLLIEAGTRLKACVREVDTVARFGGDEFVVLLGQLDSSRSVSIRQADSVAKKICATLAKTYYLKAPPGDAGKVVVDHQCTASVGVALFLDHETSRDTILKQADMAMYRAKEAGRNGVQFFDLE